MNAPEVYFGRVSVGMGCVSVRAFGYWWGYDFHFGFPYRVKA